MNKSELLRLLKLAHLPRRVRAYVRKQCPNVPNAFDWAFIDALFNEPVYLQWLCTELLRARTAELRDPRSWAHVGARHDHWNGIATNRAAVYADAQWLLTR